MLPSSMPDGSKIPMSTTLTPNPSPVLVAGASYDTAIARTPSGTSNGR